MSILKTPFLFFSFLPPVKFSVQMLQEEARWQFMKYVIFVAAACCFFTTGFPFKHTALFILRGDNVVAWLNAPRFEGTQMLLLLSFLFFYLFLLMVIVPCVVKNNIKAHEFTWKSRLNPSCHLMNMMDIQVQRAAPCLGFLLLYFAMKAVMNWFKFILIWQNNALVNVWHEFFWSF